MPSHYRVVRFILLIGGFALLTACSETEPLQTVVAPIAQTAIAEGQELVATEVAGLGGTAVSASGTAVAEQATMAAAGVGTSVAQLLTPDPPEIIATPRPEDIVSYTVIQGDNLSQIAHRFNTTTERLIELNANQYPSLLDSPNYVEVGWVLIVSMTPPATPIPRPTPYSNTPGCDVSSMLFLESPVTCEFITVHRVTDMGLSIGCVDFSSNPFGYYRIVTVQEGWILTDNLGITHYHWLGDRQTNKIVIGPAIVTSEISYPVCGLPGIP